MLTMFWMATCRISFIMLTTYPLYTYSQRMPTRNLPEDLGRSVPMHVAALREWGRQGAAPGLPYSPMQLRPFPLTPLVRSLSW